MAGVKPEGEKVETPEKKPTTRKRSTKKAADPVEKVEAPAEPEVAEPEAPADSVTESDTETQQEPAQQVEPVKRFCYMGPSLRQFGLIENMIYTGTASQMEALTKSAAEKFPGIKKLVFAAKDFEAVKKEKAAGKNYISRLYDEIKKTVRG